MAAKTALTPGTAKALKHRKWGSGEIKRHLAFLTMLLPGCVFLFCFSYMPMPAIILAFKRYQLAKPPKDYWIQNKFIYSLFVKNEWVGFSNFKFIFNTPDAWMVIRNTLGYNLVFMALGLVLSVGLAIAVNELRNRFMAKLYHTILFMPYFISWIIVAYVVYAFVSAKGVFNQWLTAFGQPTIAFYSEPKYWPFIFVFCNIWKYTGNNSIIYLATLTGFDQQLYEAAAIDGASRFQRIWHINLTGILPTITIMLILQVGNLMTVGFEKAFLMQNPLNLETSEIISTFVYKMGLNYRQYSYSTAIGLFNSVINMILLVSVNTIAGRLSETSLW